MLHKFYKATLNLKTTPQDKSNGLPRRLYLDNGSEYKWSEMLNAFNDLSKFGAACAVHLGIPYDLKGLDSKEDNVIRASVW